MKQALAELFYSTYHPLFRYVYHIVGNRADAEDIVQEAFVRLHERLQQSPEVTDMRAWLFRAARNRAIDLVRTSSTWASSRAALAVAEHVWDEQQNLDQIVLRRERLERVHAVFECLSANEREALILRSEGLRYREIAQVLEIEPGYVGTLLARALQKLREAMDGSE